MEKRVARLLRYGSIPCLIAMALCIAGTVYLRAWWFVAGEGLLFIALLLFSLLGSRKIHQKLLSWIETDALNRRLSVSDMVTNSPTPMSVIRVNTGELIWCNESFQTMTHCPVHYYDLKLDELLPDGFSRSWILSGQTQKPDLTHLGGRYFDVHCSFIHPDTEEYGTLCAILYWYDCTHNVQLQKEIDDTRAVVGELVCDNYEELAKGGNEPIRAAMLAKLDGLLQEWCDKVGGMLRKTERDKYMLLTDERGYRRFAQEKFSILEQAKEIVAPNGMALTLSIGFGRDGETLEELDRFANLAVEMALSRGGDQAVVRDKSNFSFFGGMTREIEKRTKVKTRLQANVLKRLISESASVYVMGHQMADLDALGGAVGVFCAARKLGKKAYIVLNRELNNVGPMLSMLETYPEYRGAILSPTDAIVRMDPQSLLVVVDTNNADYVEDRSILDSFNRVAVIDHHRRTASYISNAILCINEPSASSVCELIAESLQYIIGSGDMLQVEATAMLAGVCLDTKYFSQRTGTRTFDAAAYLRRNGADPNEVKRLFRNDISNYLARTELIKKVFFFDNRYAICASEQTVDRLLAAQVADDLMNIIGVAAAFVLFPAGDCIYVSARSTGQINVQLIMEKLGGGGHFSSAGAQVCGKPMEKVVGELKDAITVYTYDQ